MSAPDDISLRDYFAAQAMQALIVLPGAIPGYTHARAELAYQHADSMLAVRALATPPPAKEA